MDAVARSLAEMYVPILIVWILAAVGFAGTTLLMRSTVARWLVGVTVTLMAAGWTLQRLLTL